MRRCRHDRFVDTLNCLDEMVLDDDDVGFIENLHGHLKRIDHALSFVFSLRNVFCDPSKPIRCSVQFRGRQPQACPKRRVQVDESNWLLLKPLGIITGLGKLHYVCSSVRVIRSIRESEPGIGAMQDLYAELAVLHQFRNRVGDATFRILVNSTALKEMFELAGEHVKYGRCESPHVHGYEFITVQYCLQTVFVRADNVTILLLNALQFVDLFEKAFMIDMADSARDRFELGQRISQNETNHRLI
jgi:hypothetical protein